MVMRGVLVQRDDDYLRTLLADMAASNKWMHLSALTLSPDPDREKRHFHILLLEDAGFMQPMSAKREVWRISGAGYDFLRLTEQSATWEATKNAAQKIGGASVQMLYRIAEGYARQKLTELGVPLA